MERKGKRRRSEAAETGRDETIGWSLGGGTRRGKSARAGSDLEEGRRLNLKASSSSRFCCALSSSGACTSASCSRPCPSR
eukprot:3821477-Rhodomonas_salina.1